jgi:cell division protein FtsI (penicillin-binding protein 3)
VSRRAAGAAVRSINYATSPLLASRTPPGRSRFVVAMVGVGFLLLIGRAVHVQIVDTAFYQREGEKRFVRTLELPASRGRVLDRHGELLATSVAAQSLWIVPKEFSADAAQSERLRKLLRMSSAELDARLDGNPNFGWLRRQVDDAVAADARALGIQSGLYQVTEYKRRYPHGEAAAHVVGFTDIEGKGQEGVELGFERHLQGRDGARVVVRDLFGRPVDHVGEMVQAENGTDIELAIDSKLQFVAYQRIRDAVAQHRAKAGSAVVLDVRTGEVLALANWPSFDPHARKNLSGAQLRNRAVTDVFEPGSTMKPFAIALALDSGRVTPATRIDTGNGRMTYAGREISDTRPHGNLSVAEVLAQSSNIGTVKIAMQIPAREMWNLYSTSGFGHKPQVEFPGAVSGRLRPHKSWRPIEQATMAYGYGLSASLLQLARAYTIFARDGDIVPLSMRKLAANELPVNGRRVLSPETARTVRQMLQAAAGPQGTAPKAQTIGYSVAGKTGTARAHDGRGYGSKYRTFFVGFAPVSDPRVVVAVMIDEPGTAAYYAGDVAAPVFGQVVQDTLRALGVAPDIEFRPQIVAKPGVGTPESF